jgi:hypothetical protein
MKKNLITTMAVAVALTASMSTAVLADDDVNVIVNGETIDFTGDQAPLIKNDRTLVPFRAVFEKMGAEVNWYEDSQTCEATYGGITVTLQIGSNIMNIGDGTTVEVDVPAEIIGDRTMVPIRVISEGIGATVGWEEETRTVVVNTPEISEESPKSVETISASSGVVNEEKGLTITFNYPVVTDEYTAANSLNDSILGDAIELAEEIANQYNGEETELNIDYVINTNENGILEILYSINDETISNPTYAIEAGAKLDEAFLEDGEEAEAADANADAEDKGYKINVNAADITDDDGNVYLTASVGYPQFAADDNDVIASLNTQLENSAAKAVDSFVASYSDEALQNAKTYAFNGTCLVEISEDNIATITTTYTEVIAGSEDENVNVDVIVVNLTTGEVVSE